MAFTKDDFPEIAEYVIEEWKRRKSNRIDREKEWKEIDRQVAMIPDTGYKMMYREGRMVDDPDKAWFPEFELPLQAQSLEVLTADARRMEFPDAGPWYKAHAALTDEYLGRVDFQSLISGDRNEVPTQIDQDAADKLVEGTLDHWHRQYDFYSNIDRINAESFKYGTGLGRGRLAKKSVFINKAKGVSRETQDIPVLFPVSIKNTYLDDRTIQIMSEGYILGSAEIFCKECKLEDLKMAAKNGSTDPKDRNGGWIPNNLNDLEGDNNGIVKTIEWEGDLMFPRKTNGNIFVKGAIVDVVVDESTKKAGGQIFRFRLRKDPFSSLIQFPYHYENTDSNYATSPLVKGWPIQKAAVEALNRLLIAVALNAGPPVQWDPEDPELQAMGGPKIAPYANWPSTGDVNPHEIGDPASISAVYTMLLQQYADVVGINAPRLGAQTVSHTTAYAKEAEISQGTTRTVDYVRNSLKGPLTQWMNMAFTLGREAMRPSTIYIDAYNGYVDINKSFLPDLVTFEVHGAGGPQEEQARKQMKMAALQQALSMDQLAIATGRQPTVNLVGAIQETLRNGGWTDIDIIVNEAGGGSAGQAQGGQGLQVPADQAQTAPGAALQSLYQG